MAFGFLTIVLLSRRCMGEYSGGNYFCKYQAKILNNFLISFFFQSVIQMIVK